jgi:hypothetical protein
MLDTDQYFLKIQRGLDKKWVVDKQTILPLPDNSGSVLHGKAVGYNKKTGVVRIKLFEKVHFSTLLMSGIPFDYIIFAANA